MAKKKRFDEGELRSLGERMRAVRGSMTKQQAAVELGVSFGSLTHYEKDTRAPTSETLLAMVNKFDVDLNWLVAGQSVEEAAAMDFNEDLFLRSTTTVIEELHRQKLYNHVDPAILSSLILTVYQLVEKKFGVDADAKDISLDGLENVVRFMAK